MESRISDIDFPSLTNRDYFPSPTHWEDEVLYFLILDRYRLADGKPLIDYEEPAKSPLLQLALPREHSLNPHPAIPGEESRSDLWRPFFRSTDDRAFVRAVEWIKSMYRPRPEYPISYSPPGPSNPPAQGNEPPVVR